MSNNYNAANRGRFRPGGNNSNPEGLQIRLRRGVPNKGNQGQSNPRFRKNFVQPKPNPNQTVKLRRNITKQNVIAQNLSHMQENARKKKVAQDIYYQMKPANRSPLIRNTQESKFPVQNRLGNKIRLRRNMQGVNTTPTKRNGFIPRRNNNKVDRAFSVQNRLTRIRLNAKSEGYLQPNNAPQQIRLRRNRPQMQMNPMNYTVQVNNSMQPSKSMVSPAKYHKELNPRLQAEIRMIQQSVVVHDAVQPVPVHPLGSGVTNTTLHQRFSHL